MAKSPRFNRQCQILAKALRDRGYYASVRVGADSITIDGAPTVNKFELYTVLNEIKHKNVDVPRVVEVSWSPFQFAAEVALA